MSLHTILLCAVRVYRLVSTKYPDPPGKQKNSFGILNKTLLVVLSFAARGTTNVIAFDKHRYGFQYQFVNLLILSAQKRANKICQLNIMNSYDGDETKKNLNACRINKSNENTSNEKFPRKKCLRSSVLIWAKNCNNENHVHCIRYLLHASHSIGHNHVHEPFLFYYPLLQILFWTVRVRVWANFIQLQPLRKQTNIKLS